MIACQERWGSHTKPYRHRPIERDVNRWLDHQNTQRTSFYALMPSRPTPSTRQSHVLCLGTGVAKESDVFCHSFSATNERWSVSRLQDELDASGEQRAQGEAASPTRARAPSAISSSLVGGKDKPEWKMPGDRRSKRKREGMRQPNLPTTSRRQEPGPPPPFSRPPARPMDEH